MPIYTYRCGCGQDTEAIRPMSVEALACSCGQQARRMGANRVAVIGPTADTRNMYRRYIEASAEIDYTLTQHERNTGQPSPSLDLWTTAKQAAQGMVATGEAPAVRMD